METRASRIAAVLILLGFALSVLSFVGGSVSASATDGGLKTQLCMVIDGSGSVNGTEWSIILNAVATGINETIPHDGSVELTIVQFGGLLPARARTEIPPTVIDGENYAGVASQVLSIPKSGGGTTIPDGLYLGWMEIRNSTRFSDSARQIINLATDELPGIRNSNATTDMDGSGGDATARDDAIAVIDGAVGQGLDELDVEGIALTDSARDWYKNWAVRPQPGAVAPPFSKPGWIRIVADVPAFANTLGEKLQVIIVGKSDVWVPSAEGALLAGLFSVGLTGLFSLLSSAVSNPETFPSVVVAQKINSFLPETFKKWLADFISSKRKTVLGQKVGAPFVPTRWEVVSYAVALSVLTLAFSYARVVSLSEILSVLPTVLATSIVVEFVKNFSIVAVARWQGVWTEHRLWYFGLFTFMFSSLVFRVPFSSPSRLTHNSPRFTRRSLGLVALSSVFVGLTFAAFFFGLLAAGFTLVGNIGLVMCLTMAFFETVPIPPMSGKDLYEWSKPLWMSLFTTTFALYMLCLFLL